MDKEDIWKPKILGIFNGGESQSALSREIEMLEVKNNIYNGMDLATRTYRVYEYIINTIKENGDISQFKEDVLYIIHGLLQKQLSTKELTVTQIVVENRDKEMQLERERYMKNKMNELEQKEFILDKVTEKLSKMKQSIEKLKNRDGESMLMVDVCIQNIIAFYDDIEKIF